MNDLHELLLILDYDPASGIFTWRVKPSKNIYKGSVAGTKTGRYVYIHYKRKGYLAHRLAWLVSFGQLPLGDIDHIDGNGTNNALVNLREATASQNIANSRLSTTNTSGAKGVSFNPRNGRWTAQIKHNYNKIHIGTFDTFEEAVAARQAKATELFSTFARH